MEAQRQGDSVYPYQAETQATGSDPPSEAGFPVYDCRVASNAECVTLPSPNHSPQGAPMAQASARHILVSTEAKCNELKTAIENGADFAQVAKENSSCPSSRDGGNLGTFGPGQMVKEFDTVVFSAPVGVVQGPVKTQFGYHLVEVTSRKD
ncbi:hypothetical protein G6F65_014924 [Rhizopus arrhizus]|nr:hypothetical protein G6F65_014924 [Rhizopus arrhizus]